jgi:hypothetical protein
MTQEETLSKEAVDLAVYMLTEAGNQMQQLTALDRIEEICAELNISVRLVLNNAMAIVKAGN